MFNSRVKKICLHLRSAIFVAVLLAAFSRARAQDDSTNHPAVPRKPSIILIVADDLGFGDLGCYGQTKIKTPNIDQLAAQGMRFTSCYGGTALGTPSRAALMTGRDTGHARIRGDGSVPLQEQDLTLTEFLKKTGYNTGGMGEWGFGGNGTSGMPAKKGFYDWFGYLEDKDAQDYYPIFLFRSEDTREKNLLLSENQDNQRITYSDDYFNKAALNYIKIEQPQWYTHYQPFFLYLPYTIVRANNELAASTGNGMQVPDDEAYADESWPQPEKNKAAMITRLDGYVGSIMARLKDRKIDNNTIVIFTSANGPHKEGGVDPRFFQSAGGLRGVKRDLYEGGIRVPLIVSFMWRIKAGSVSDVPCALWDLPATIADMLGTNTFPNTEGISLFPTLYGQTQTNRHESLYWELHDKGFQQALRLGDWKAVRLAADAPLELYNLKTDPAEKDNVADKNPKVIARVENILKTARIDDPNWPIKTTAESSQTVMPAKSSP